MTRVPSSYFRISDEMVVATHNVDNTILIDIDTHGKVIGIETLGKDFSLEEAIEVIKSFTYPEIIVLPTDKPIMLRVE